MFCGMRGPNEIMVSALSATIHHGVDRVGHLEHGRGQGLCHVSLLLHKFNSLLRVPHLYSTSLAGSVPASSRRLPLALVVVPATARRVLALVLAFVLPHVARSYCRELHQTHEECVGMEC